MFRCDVAPFFNRIILIPIIPLHATMIVPILFSYYI